MKHIKLFEELSIPQEEYSDYGYELNSKETQILIGLVGEDFLGEFRIRKEDNYYYTHYDDDSTYYNKLNGFKELKDYLFFR